MVSKYDLFYVIATEDKTQVTDIVKALHKKKEDYRNIHNKVKELKKDGYVKINGNVKIILNLKTKKLFNLISFCIKNKINYNFLFKETMLKFIQKAAKKEFFTREDVNLHPQTYNLYTTALARYGFLLITSRNPLKCKLLRHHFLFNLLNFFGKELIFYQPEKHFFVKEIKKELRKYQNLKKFHYTIFADLEKKEQINFIHISLSLEGNPITLPDTQKIIEEEIIPKKYKLIHVLEVANYKKAVDLMIEKARERVKLDLPLILEYHKIAMNHIHGAGEIRKQNVRIKLNPNFKTCDWQLIYIKLNELMEKYEQFKSEKIAEVIKFATFFHNEFQRIHPFIDGNSRTSRLLMLHILRSYDLPVLDLPLGYFDEYMDLTKRSTTRNDEAFQHLIEEVVYFNLKKVNSVV